MVYNKIKQRSNQMERDLTILIVEDDITTCKKLADYVTITEGVSIAAITNNSYRAIEYAENLLPDAIILDLELHEGQGNGLTFLQDLRNLNIKTKPYILVTTNVTSSTTYEYARQYGADFIMTKHTEDYSEQNVIDFLKMMKDIIQNNLHQQNPDYDITESEDQRKKRLTRIINMELDNIGISPKAVGYNYLTDAILLVLDGKKANLSTEIGAKYGKTFSSVDRAMQNAINKAWGTTDIDTLLKNYKANIRSEKGVPTLTEFVHYYATKIKNEY